MKAFSLQFCDHKTVQSTPKQKLRYKNLFQQAKHKSAMPLPALMLPLQLQEPSLNVHKKIKLSTKSKVVSKALKCAKMPTIEKKIVGTQTQ